MNSETSRQIKNRKQPRDVFYTPKALAKKAIDMANEPTPTAIPNIWYDPFYGADLEEGGAYYEQFPPSQGQKHQWAEISIGRDFFTYKGDNDILCQSDLQRVLTICSNPPYSCIDKVLNKCIELKADTINLLLAQHAITPRRMELMEKAHYHITKMHICKVYQWYGMSSIVQWEKMIPHTESGSVDVKLTYDRKVWRTN